MPAPLPRHFAVALLALVLAALPFAGISKECQSVLTSELCSRADSLCEYFDDSTSNGVTTALSLLQRAASVSSRRLGNLPISGRRLTNTSAVNLTNALPANLTSISAANWTNTTEETAKHFRRWVNGISQILAKLAEQYRHSKEANGGSPPIYFNVSAMTNPQLVLVTIVYMYFLSLASQMVSDGSESLRVFPSGSGIVGSVLVPFLGALPESALVLFSGLGAHAQDQITSGMGIIAGSTVLLLTLPWCIVILVGGVPLQEDGTADYSRSQEPAALCTSGITFGNLVVTYTKFMLTVSFAYLIIQIPACFFDKTGLTLPHQAEAESGALLAATCFTFVLFLAYIFLLYYKRHEDMQLQVIVDNIRKKNISLETVVSNLSAKADENSREISLQRVLRYCFADYDLTSNGFLERKEFAMLLTELGVCVSEAEANAIFHSGERARDGRVSLDEFCDWACKYPSIAKDDAIVDAQIPPVSRKLLPTYGIEDEESEILPANLMDEPRTVQECSILFRSFYQITFGLILVLFFSAPTVNVFTEWAKRFRISSFYISFVLAPLALHGGQLFIAYGFARAKTSKKINLSLESLIGLACMNNTLCLCVFLAVMYFRHLAWQFGAETFGLLMTQWTFAAIILSSNTQRKLIGFALILMYPVCLIVVQILHNYAGWD